MALRLEFHQHFGENFGLIAPAALFGVGVEGAVQRVAVADIVEILPRDSFHRTAVESADERTLVIVCERAGGVVAPASKVTIRVEGPDGLPSAIVHCTSESRGGLFARDRQNVQEFMTPFHRRVC